MGWLGGEKDDSDEALAKIFDFVAGLMPLFVQIFDLGTNIGYLLIPLRKEM